MKTFRILGHEINLSFSIERVKTVTVNLPDEADDVHVRDGKTGFKIFDDEWSDGTPDGKPKLCYYSSLALGVHYVDLPEKTKYAKKVYLTPRTQIIDNKKVYSKNRICVVNCYF